MSKNKEIGPFFGKFWKKIATKYFFQTLQNALKKTFAVQERSTITTAKTIGKALAAFDELSILKTPSSGGTTTIQKTESTMGNALGQGAGVLLSVVGKVSQFTDFLRVITQLPRAFFSLIDPGQRSAGVLERIVGIFRQTEITGAAVRAKTDAVALSAGRMAGAWGKAASTLLLWQSTSAKSANATKISREIQPLTQRVQSLAGSFRGCNVASTLALNSIQNNWSGLNGWFRTNVADPMIRDTNKLLGGITAGFNQMLANGGAAGSGKTLSAPQIPHLAQGAVLPANRPFLAMVGDQRNGTNVEAPLDTIKQAVAEVVGKNDVVIQFTGDLAQLARVLRPAITRESARVGGSLIVKEVL